MISITRAGKPAFQGRPNSCLLVGVVVDMLADEIRDETVFVPEERGWKCVYEKSVSEHLPTCRRERLELLCELEFEGSIVCGGAHHKSVQDLAMMISRPDGLSRPDEAPVVNEAPINKLLDRTKEKRGTLRQWHRWIDPLSPDSRDPIQTNLSHVGMKPRHLRGGSGCPTRSGLPGEPGGGPARGASRGRK
jgi:hypothetical protein